MKKTAVTLKAKEKSMARRFAENCAATSGTAIALCAALLCAAAVLLMKADVSHSLHEPITTVISALATLLSTYVAGASGKSTGVSFGAICGFLVFTVLFAASLIFGDSEVTYQALVKLLALVSAGGIGSLASARKTKNNALKI
ncbi:MAG: TIGR04086 family membrane protein [Oscillospiraceae bacterium]|nr:TIGR04086 family membrane protein [Oscillospiraceae bacterium]